MIRQNQIKLQKTLMTILRKKPVVIKWNQRKLHKRTDDNPKDVAQSLQTTEPVKPSGDTYVQSKGNTEIDS